MKVKNIYLIAFSIVVTIWIVFCIFFSVIYWLPFTQVIKTNPYYLYIYFSDFGIPEHFLAVTEVKLSLLFQRKTLDPPLFELVVEIPKNHFKVGEEIPVKLYLINKSNYPITIVHDVPFPLFVIYDENDRPIYGGLQHLVAHLPVLRPGQPYYGWDSRRPLPRKDLLGVYRQVNSDLKIAIMNDGYRLIASKPGSYTLKASAEFEILDMKRYVNLTDRSYKKIVIEKKEIRQPLRVYVED